MIPENTGIASRTPRERREFWLFLLIALVVLGAGIGLRDPWPADEPRFTLAAKHMVDSGEWLITHRGSELYSDKPPMFMAMQAASYELTRSWRIAFLLPSLLAALGTLFLIYDFGRRQWDHRVGLWAGILVLSTFQFAYQSKRAQIDPLVMFFITLANYGLLRHMLLGPNWRAYWLGCFAAGLGVITKGVGVLALLMLLPFAFARWRHWQNLADIKGGTLRWLAGALAFLVAIALWIVPMVLTVHGSSAPEYHAYLQDILFRQTAARYTESWDHHQPWWYFAGVIAYGWLPLSIILIGVVPRWTERLMARDARFLLPLAWVALILLFFSFPSGKRDVYIMPALPWVALLAAPFIDELLDKRWLRRALFGLTVLLAAIFLTAGIGAWNGWIAAANELVVERGLGNGGAGLWGFLIAVGTIAALAALLFRVRRSAVGLGVSLAGIWLLWGFWAYPVLNDSTSAAKIMRKAGEIAGPTSEIALVGWKEQNLLFADREVTEFGFKKPKSQQLAEAIRWQELKPDSRWVFILDRVMPPCIDRDKAVVVGHANRREWLMFKSNAVATACRGGRVPETKAETAEQIEEE
ncbi:MAG TPA: glycosyltransferase family 39 protein [Dokdonella sp.]|uniref:ArnT family glycosyltransferase n=1 Tax=Dokdonella sp. TaxID=2291710 RepID=UPI002D7EB586|nr:glycosyltransferase family 39 protein [Dokdonella sp.]HET9032885.1 glycosyltransferase family 39 protein [Dokdonella sp.]